MKIITITMSDEAVRTLRTAVAVRSLSGNLGGAIDSFTTRVVEAVDAGETTLELKTREEREADLANRS